MRTLYVEGLASHDGPEPCVGCPRGRRRSVGRGTRRRGYGAATLVESGVPTPWVRAGGKIAGGVMPRAVGGPRAVEESRHVWRLGAREPGELMAARLGDGGAGRSGKAEAVRLGCTAMRSRTGR